MLIAKCLFGSHLYGLATEHSDTDYKGIFLPTKKQLLLGTAPKSYSTSTGAKNAKNTSSDVDTEIFSLAQFIKLACDGETVAIDMLHQPFDQRDLDGSHLVTSDIWEELKSRRQLFYCKDMKSYIGYARRQANKYGIKGSRIAEVERIKSHLWGQSKLYKLHAVADILPKGEFCGWVTTDTGTFYEVCGRKFQNTLTVGQLNDALEKILDEYGTRAQEARNNGGIDWKAVSHALRAAYQMRLVLREGDFEYPLPETEFLRLVKTGSLDFVGTVQPELESVIEEIEALSEVSSLPEKVDREYWENFLLEVYDRQGY